MSDANVHAEGTGPEDRGILTRRARGPSQEWVYGPDASQVADVYLPDDDVRRGSPVALIHGGFWRPEYDRTHLRPLAAALAADGHPVVLLEYRRIPGSPDATTGDVRLACTGIPELLADRSVATKGSLQVLGHSAGGQLALWLIGQPGIRVGSCLALAPVADLLLAERLGLDADAVEAFLGDAPLNRPDLDPRRLPAPRVPVTVVHGRRDSLVPIAVSRSFCRKGVRLVEVPDCAHYELIDPASNAWPVVSDELARLADAAPDPDPTNVTADPRWGIE